MTPRALAFCALLAACGSNEATDPGAWVEVGSGEATFEPLEDGQSLELISGIQGGWHIDITAHFGGIPVEGAVVTYRVWDEERQAQLGYPVKRALGEGDVTSRGDGSFEVTGDRVVFAVDAPAEVIGLTVLAEVELVQDSIVYRDQRAVVVVDTEDELGGVGGALP